MRKSLPPVIKWPGSKRKIAAQLSAFFPDADRYYEPFVGGGAMLPFRRTRSAIAGDILPELIALWVAIRDQPSELAEGYSELWRARQSKGHTVFYQARERFNRTRHPIDLLFLSRQCVNGLVRFNRHGEFNNSLHHTRPGIEPAKLTKIINAWSGAVQGIEFQVADFRRTLAPVRKGDFVFLDPPYESTRGRYRPGTLKADDLYSELDRLNCLGARWILTYDGSAGPREYKTKLPANLYKQKVVLNTGHSPFTRLMGTAIDTVVESVYLNYKLPGESCSSVTEKAQEPVQLGIGFDMES